MYFGTIRFVITGWVPGVKVRGGTLSFIVTRDRGVEWTQSSASPPCSPIPNFLPASPLGLYPVHGATRSSDRVDALLSALPTQEDLDDAISARTDVATPEDSSFFPFESVSAARSFERLTLDFLASPDNESEGRQNTTTDRRAPRS